jgi:hypothetical protein
MVAVVRPAIFFDVVEDAGRETLDLAAMCVSRLSCCGHEGEEDARLVLISIRLEIEL